MNDRVNLSMKGDSVARSVTRDGAGISQDGEIWRVTGASSEHYFSFGRMTPFASENVITAAKRLVLHYIEKHSLSHAENVLDRFAGFIRFAGKTAPIVQITASDVLAYRVTLDRNTEWYLGTLRGFFRNWRDLRLPGLDGEVVAVLDKIRLKGNRKGEAVRVADPHKGPFTDLEYQALILALNDAFAQGEIRVGDYILIQLFLALGARPIQLAGLKLCDFSCTQASDGAEIHLLQVPRAKQRYQALRAEFKPRRLSRDLGRAIEAYCESTRRQWAHLDLDPKQLPFFVNPKNDMTTEGLLYHCTGRDLAKRVQAVFDVLNVISERTGNQLDVIARRFRSTLGTRAAREGLSEFVIAELLDHTDTQNVGVYVEAVPDIVERIDKAMALHLAPIAQAFAGVLIDSEEQAHRAGDPRSRIVNPTDLKHPVGSCGSYGFCGAMAPIACYTCRNFQPWVDGPHEQVLEQLLVERERIKTETGDALIASVNDRVIYACAQVVSLCQQRMAECA